MMEPEAFVRLSIGLLGLRLAPKIDSSCCCCETRLRGFPVQTTPLPLVTSSSDTTDANTATSLVFYLDKSNIINNTSSSSSVAKSCFHSPPPTPFLEIVVYNETRNKKKKKKLGTFKILDVETEWGDEKPMLLHNGWKAIGNHKQQTNGELHLRVKMDPDPRFVFQFEDETALSPQIVQIQGSIKQPIFSCKFIRDRRASQDPIGNYWPSSDSAEQDSERRERKGWKVMIHDLSGSAAAAAFMATPFVPSTGCDFVARSNPGSWLIVRPDPVSTSETWHPWGRLEAWRETGTRGDSICLRLYLLPEYQDTGVLVSELSIPADKGGEFFIDTDRQSSPLVVSPKESSSGELSSTSAKVSGFVMSCKVQGEGKMSKPLVHLAMRHVTCVEDAAIFMALASAVDLSVAACVPFRRKFTKANR